MTAQVVAEALAEVEYKTLLLKDATNAIASISYVVARRTDDGFGEWADFYNVVDCMLIIVIKLGFRR